MAWRDGFAKCFLYEVTVNGWIETDKSADWFDAFADKYKCCPMS